MKDKDIFDLVTRYEQMVSSGKSVYFDAEDFDEIADYYDMADEPDKAESVIDQALNIHPGNHILILKKIKLIAYKGEYQEALSLIDGYSGDSYDVELSLLKLDCLLNLGYLGQAQELTQEIFTREKEDLDVIYSELGFIYSGIEDYDAAIAFFEKSLSYNKENVDVLAELAYTYESKSEFTQAIRALQRILDIEPYSYETWLNVGKLHSLLEEYENAIDAFDFAMTINDSYNDVRKLKAHCLLLCGRIDEAVVLFKECLKEDEEDKTLYYSLYECYLSVEQYEDALAYLEKYETLCGESAEIFAKKATIYLQKGEFDKSLFYLHQGMTIDSKNVELNLIIGELYFQMGDLDMAEDYFLKIYSGKADDRNMLDRLARISIKKNDTESATDYLEKLMELEPENEQTRIRLALLYFESGDKNNFDRLLTILTDEEVESLSSIIFSEEQDGSSPFSREDYINRLNNARECRQLYKNIIY
ncbi:MAG: tetratricopeptide repeat protein [Dysgonomonas sp.]